MPSPSGVPAWHATGQGPYQSRVRIKTRTCQRRVHGDLAQPAGWQAAVRGHRWVSLRKIVRQERNIRWRISGHKTRSIFDRYHIVAPEDLKRAASLIGEAHG